MQKLTLNLDALAVESFDPQAAAPRERGTVQGHEVLTPMCAVTSGINSCWCSEYNTCDCA